MAKRRQKAKQGSETLELNILEVSPAELAKIVGAEGLERFGLYPLPSGRGVSFGSPMMPNEFRGEGLPELGADREVLGEWNLNLKIRSSFDSEGNTYLDVARPGSGIHHQFKWNGMDYNDALRASGEFNNFFENFLIYYAIDRLFEAVYWGRSPSKVIRDDAYKATMRSLESYFKSILKPKRKREVEKRKVRPGVTIRTLDNIETGREPKTATAIEQEKQQFIAEVFEALKRIETEGGKRTQLDVGNILFGDSDSEDIQSLMKDRCKKYSIKWNELIAEYNLQKSGKN